MSGTTDIQGAPIDRETVVRRIEKQVVERKKIHIATAIFLGLLWAYILILVLALAFGRLESMHYATGFMIVGFAGEMLRQSQGHTIKELEILCAYFRPPAERAA